MAVSESSIHQHLKLLRQTSGQMEIFQRFMETSGQGLGMADLDGWIFYVNAGLCQMRGLEHPDESYDQELFTFYPPEEAKRIKEEILPLVRQEGQWVGELKILNVQGSAIPVIQNIFLLRDEKDRPLCFATVITDITERIFQEEELRIYRDQLAKLVAERTAQLEKANALLRTEIVERKRAEAEYARLTSIMENTSDLVALVTPDGWLTYMNAAGRRMLGWGEDEDISARHLRDAHAASDLRVIMEEGIPTAVKNGLWRGESNVLRQNGQVISVSQVIMAHRGAGGEITYISTIMRDITERKQAEEALRASEIRYRRLFEAAQDGILILNEENGQIEDVNPFLKNLLGYTHEEFMGKKLWEIGAFKDTKAARDAFALLRNEGYVRYEDLPLVTKDGREMAVEFVSNVYRINGHKVIQCNIRDITDRKQVEEASRESEKRFRGLAESMNQLVWVADADGKTIYLNARYIEYTGLKEPTAEERWNVIHPDDRPLVLKTWQGDLPSDREFKYTCRMRRADGVYRWFLIRGEVIRGDDGRITRWFGTATDIDDLKRTEQALQDNLARLADAERIGRTGSWKLDILTNDFVFSPELLTVLGLPQNATLSFATFQSLIHPDEVTPLDAKWRDSVDNGMPLAEECRIVLPDGTIRHLLGRTETIIDQNGKPVLLRGAVQDISERKVIEQALQEKMSLLAEAERIGRTGSWQYNLVMKDFSCSSGLLRMMSFAENEKLTIEKFITRIHPEDLDVIRRAWRRSVKEKTPFSGEHRIILPDGMIRYIITRAEATLDLQGEPVLIRSTVQDITNRKRMELELQEKMNLLADAERMGNMGSWKSDVFMNHMVLSDQLRRMWAFGENEEITKEKMLLRIHADDREDIREKIQEVIEKNAHFTSDYRIVLPDGTMRHICGNIEAACNPQGKPLFIHGTVQDITERKKEEAERARLTEILESSTDLVGISYPDGRGLYMNRAGRLMAGFGLDEDLSRYKSSEMHPAWALRIVEEEGMPEAMAKGSWEGETAIVTRDGKEIPVFQSIMVHRNSGGEIDCISTIMHDITERKRAEKAFQENLSLLAEAERIGQIGSWETDVNMNPVKLSSGLRRIWGFPEGRNVSGDELVSRIHPDDRENMLRGWRASIDQGTSSSHEYRIVLPDGTLRHVFATSEVIFDAQGKAAGVHGVVQDITQRKRLEDEMINAQKLESIGTLAGGLAHDFNNLLATIMGSLEVAKMDMDETDRPYAMLTKAEQAVLTARDLTRQLLTFSRGGHPISVVMTINQLLADTVRLALKGSVTQLEWKVAENLPEINIDENQIIQVIHNIVLNAREAMSQAGKLTIKADEVTIDRDNALKLKEGTYVRLVFRDEGKGIRAEHVPKLFEPYFSTKEMGNKKGMGLGLAVCYSIMKRHQGYIQVDSREGAGTDVSLYFPAAVKRHS